MVICRRCTQPPIGSDTQSIGPRPVCICHSRPDQSGLHRINEVQLTLGDVTRAKLGPPATPDPPLQRNWVMCVLTYLFTPGCLSSGKVTCTCRHYDSKAVSWPQQQPIGTVVLPTMAQRSYKLPRKLPHISSKSLLRGHSWMPVITQKRRSSGGSNRSFCGLKPSNWRRSRTNT